MPLITESPESYHANPAASRSMLWALQTGTPYRARYAPAKESHAFDLGTAAHIAILEPHRFDAAVMRGPIDRRGNKWKDAEIEAEAIGALLLTEKDHDKAQLLRDVAAAHPIMRRLMKGAVVEQSAYADDNGNPVKVRPDIANDGMSIIADLKSTSDLTPDGFSKSIAKYGYHLQAYMYSRVYALASGKPVDAFMFVCVSSDDLPEIACYDVDDLALEEGARVYERSLAKWDECMKSGVWPSYPAKVQTLSLPAWAISKGE